MKKLKEIAEMAGVSPTAVSFVLNGRPGVSEEKRREIGLLLRQNGYTLPEDSGAPSTEKLTIRFIKYKKHGMLVDGNPGFVNAIIDAVEKECRRQRCTLNMTSCNAAQLPEMADVLREDPADGVLFLGTELTEDEASRCLSGCELPTVFLDTNLPRTDFNCVTMNNSDAIFNAVEHLAELGHRRIGFLANAVPANNCRERRHAFAEAMRQAGLSFDEAAVYSVYPTPEGAYAGVRELLAGGEAFPPALVANNDSIALGAMKAMKEAGLRVPEDISLVGFDDIGAAALSDPPLTTLSVSRAEMGIWAVRLLCDRMRYPFSAAARMQISPKLVVRGTTCRQRRQQG